MPFRVGWPEIRQVSYRLVDNRADAARIPNRSMHLSSASVWTFLIVLTSVANSTVARNHRERPPRNFAVLIRFHRETAYSNIRLRSRIRIFPYFAEFYYIIFIDQEKLWAYSFKTILTAELLSDEKPRNQFHFVFYVTDLEICLCVLGMKISKNFGFYIGFTLD